MSADSTILMAAESALSHRNMRDAAFLFDQAEFSGCDRDRCAAGRWTISMLTGDFEGAWSESDAIRKRNRPDPKRFWNGESWAGKRLMIRCLHGYGDAVQFLRFTPTLRAQSAHLTVECDPRAVELIRCFNGIDKVVTWGRDAPASPPAWDVQMEAMEIPYVLRASIAELPCATKYLALPTRALDEAGHFISHGTKSLSRVGIVWSAGTWNLSRSIPLHVLNSILMRTEFEFWNLQGGSVRERWHEIHPRANLRDAPILADAGLLSLAAVIAHLDLVVTVDTLAAHLAGALGVPCFLMLQFETDWRWMIGRNDSPWYPSIRLFRQTTPGDWISVVNEINRALTEWLLNRKQPERAA